MRVVNWALWAAHSGSESTPRHLCGAKSVGQDLSPFLHNAASYVHEKDLQIVQQAIVEPIGPCALRLPGYFWIRGCERGSASSAHILGASGRVMV